jgi:DNA-binding NarL/FixJ family response regulator
MRILISDAISHNRENLASFLSESGLQVVGSTASGIETLKLAMETKPDIIIQDVNLPDVDALELIMALSKLERGPAVILLMVSHDPTVVKRGLQAGAYACLAKNEGIDPVVDMIQKIQKTNYQGD